MIGDMDSVFIKIGVNLSFYFEQKLKTKFKNV